MGKKVTKVKIQKGRENGDPYKIFLYLVKSKKLKGEQSITISHRNGNAVLKKMFENQVNVKEDGTQLVLTGNFEEITKVIDLINDVIRNVAVLSLKEINVIDFDEREMGTLLKEHNCEMEMLREE